MIEIANTITKWYTLNKRDLPWRDTQNPYKIWISEIILQQTRVAQALNYYINFLYEFPDVYALASASQQKVLKLWQGLGYYSRARNLHFSANYIVSELKGKFPESYKELKILKGIGEYTAAAIASFAYGECVPVVDGNVYRVLARLFAEKSPIDSSQGKKIFLNIASELIKFQKPDIFNQAIMEFGALQCVPVKPDCLRCPLNEICIAYANKIVDSFPVKKKMDKKIMRFFNYFFIDNLDYTFIKRRNKDDIWKGLFEFPLIETSKATDYKSLINTVEWLNMFGKNKITLHSTSSELIHRLTHQTIHVVFYSISTSQKAEKLFEKNTYQKILLDDLEDYPVSKLIENFITEIFN